MVSVSTTEPFALSLALGLYVAFNTVALEKEPVPAVVHVPVVLKPVTLPASRTDELLTHRTTSAPALASDCGWIVNVRVSVTTAQPSVEVKVRITEPAEMSEAVALYTAFKADAFGEKVPDPLVLQIPVLPPTVTDPFNSWVALAAQTVPSAPAFTTGNGVIVNQI